MQNTRVRDIMSSPAITVAPNTTVPAANALMKQHNIRHLPVVENGCMVGLVSRGDLREASSRAAINADSYELHFALNRLTVERLMTRKVYTITPEAYVAHAAELMTQHKIAGLPVVAQDGSVVGIVTETDLLKLLATKLREAEAAEAAV